MNKIWIAGVGFETEARVVRWDEPGGFNAHPHRCSVHPRPLHPCGGGGVYPYSKQVGHRAYRYMKRGAMRGEFSLAAAQGVIRQFVIHHDGCPNARVCFEVLHNERGLSCHFLLDNDGTIYQTLDLAYMAFHAAGFNSHSIGVEMSNRGDAKKYPGFYHGRRDVTTCRIHGHTYLAYGYTDAQYEALGALARSLARALPNVPIDYPQDSPGHQAWSVADHARSYAGYLGHYHTTKRKWDPGPFDFKSFCKSIRGRRSFPLGLKGERPDVPEDTEALRARTDALYDLNERKTEGGYFPVGPLGRSRLWHGGLHLSAQAGTPLYAPFAGRVVAARMGATSPIGSTNFVLLRHELSVGTQALQFYTLLFHIADDSARQDADDAPGWIKGDGWRAHGGRGRVILLDEPVEAGQIVGRVGTAGPAGHRRPQVHFEIFAADEILAGVQANVWTVIDGTAGGRFSTGQGALAEIDVAPKDGQLSHDELVDFFAGNADRRLLRYVATLNVSEWIATPSWADALRLAPDFHDLDRREIDRLVAEQVTPTLWWTEKVARHARLPRDGVVYHYHPITFVKFVNEKLLEAEILADDGVGAFSADEAKVTPDDVFDDREDVSGESFVADAELEEQDYGHDLTLEDLANGFPE
jgi:N-acetyl-anhydromuramyl-L-alanine amidase AmpD/murein DD-endopeptidase MepM/ murein hydrolase activator NlpD